VVEGTEQQIGGETHVDVGVELAARLGVRVKVDLVERLTVRRELLR